MNISMNDLLKKYGPEGLTESQEPILPEESAGVPEKERRLEPERPVVKQETPAFSSGHFERRRPEPAETMTGVFGADEESEADQNHSARGTAVRGWLQNGRRLWSERFRLTERLPELWWVDLIGILITVLGIWYIIANLEQILYGIFQLICSFLSVAVLISMILGMILILHFALRRRRRFY